MSSIRDVDHQRSIEVSVIWPGCGHGSMRRFPTEKKGTFCLICEVALNKLDDLRRFCSWEEETSELRSYESSAVEIVIASASNYAKDTIYKVAWARIEMVDWFN